MTRKKRKNKNNNEEVVGLQSVISTQEYDLNEKKDNSIWWSLGLLFFMSCVVAVWAITTF